MLSLLDVTVLRGKKHVAGPINLEIGRGEVLGLTGANGSGKTSTLLATLGLVDFSGELTRGFSAAKLGVVWQDRGLPLNISVNRWIKYLSQVFATEIDKSLFERFQLPLDGRLIRTLSGGQQQKLAIISAFFHAPEFLILDEPTVGLDEQSRLEFLQLTKEFVNAGASVLITSHITNDIVSLTSNIFSLTETRDSLKFLVTTNRKISAVEIDQLLQLDSDITIQTTENGYEISASKNPFSLLANFSAKADFQIKSFTELS